LSDDVVPLVSAMKNVSDAIANETYGFLSEYGIYANKFSYAT
jgi:hypothetical protein